MTEQQHPLTDEICDELWDEHACYFNLYEEVRLTCRAAYDMGYTEGLEDAQDIITCLQRKNSPSKPVTLEELAVMRPEVVDLPQDNSEMHQFDVYEPNGGFIKVREFSTKLESGEYLREWNGYAPHYAGCFYGSDLVLGGEEKFRQCYGFFSGIGDVEWWIKEELDKLTSEEQEELLFILKRNKAFHEYTGSIVPELAKLLNVKSYQVYRVPNKDLYEFLNLIHNNRDHNNKSFLKFIMEYNND